MSLPVVPASLSVHTPKYRVIARQLPMGGVLICTPSLQKQCQA
jgi:hypothetical protein